ncbi:MAG TPA: peptidoglycan-binding protein, partial [Pyrinomonadaceae bacterium]
MKNRLLLRFSSALVLLSLLLASSGAASLSARAAETDADSAAERLLSWEATGPLGGDVRSLVIDPQDPRRLYFGTIDGQMYTSSDGGETWSRVSGFNRPGLLIDSIIVDPRDSNVIYAAAHRHKEAGGFFKTTDGGRTWRESEQLKGDGIHAFTQSPKDPDMLLAGSNRGVWRSMDAGERWELLDTKATPGLVNVDSLAVDPRDSNVIYAGTWYLPYKTTDGGRTWGITKTGVIDDSDIFAIEIDRRNPDHVIMSACSGIYETKNAGAQWRKVNGIPSQSRRTRAILQNPGRPDTIYAGTTEGFWMSVNGGADWKVTTSRQIFEVNTIAVHPSNPDVVYIGTNNYGVMVSRDGGRNFTPSNGGYSGRRAYAVVPDREKPGRVYATTINTATGGGYFYVSNDAGETWQLSARNMPPRLIAYTILQDASDGNIIYLGTNNGLYRSADRGATWSPLGAPKPKAQPRKGRKAGAARTPAASSSAASRDGASVAAPTVAARPQANDVVKRAQEAMNLAGYDVGKPDGVAGTRTVAALRKYQTDKGIPVTGQFDAPTLGALGLAGGMQSAGALAAAMQTSPIFLVDTINALGYTGDERDGRPGMLAATNAGLFRTYDVEKGWEVVPYGPNLDVRTLCVWA